MERLDLTIRAVRDQTGNQQYSATQGIRQREFIRYANDAQMRIYNLIMQERSSLYMKLGYLDVVANQALYTLPTDIFLKHNILKVDYSTNGDARLYSPLDLRTPRQEVSAPGYPDSYLLRQGQIVLTPIPQQAATNGLRLNYQYIIPALDIRRGTISAITTGGAYTTSITLTPATVTDETADDLVDGWAESVSVVNAAGTIISQSTGLPVSSYVEATGVLTFTASSVLTASNALTVGQYVTFGANATTHSQLPEVAERYLREYMALRIQMRDSNTESSDTSQVLRSLEEEILDSIANLEEDLPSIPILDTSMLNYDEDL